MESTSKVVKGEDGTFVDKDCCVTFQGSTFCARGGFICKDASGKFIGGVYANDAKGMVSNWDGSITCVAAFGRVWQSNFGDKRCAVYFHYNNRAMFGIWYSMDFNQYVRMREIKSW